MSHCQECWSSTPSRDYAGEAYKALCAAKGSSCPHPQSRNFRPSSAFVANSDCPACLHASSMYDVQFAPETHFRCCPGFFLTGQNRDVAVDCRTLMPSGFCHNVSGYELVAGVSHGTVPQCTCQHSQNFVCATHTALLAERGAKFCTQNISPPKYKVISSLKDYADSPVHDSNLTLFSGSTPVKYSQVKSANSSLVVSTPGKDDAERNFQLCELDVSLPEDILQWKKKHIEQLQAQQTEVSENNITDELKDIKTSSSVVSVQSTPTTTTMTLTPAPPTSSSTDDNNELKCEADSTTSSYSAENQILRIEQLEVELHRQQLKVKLYESMLRKHRLDMKALQLSMQDQRIAYEEQINALQKQLLRFKEQKMNPVTEYTNVRSWISSEALQMQPSAEQNFGVASENSSKVHAETLSLDGASALESRLARLQQEISSEEEALCSLREDLATKDQHLKTLRMTLKELSSCNCELLEKNLELEDMLHRKRNHSSSTVRSEAVENRLLKEIDSCISELNSTAMALMNLASGLDPLPAFLLHGCDEGVVQSDFVTGNDRDAVKARLDRASELQRRIGELRELVMQRILSNHYAPKSTS